MELEIIKTQTTWNDASQSINNNFVKIRQAILSLLSGGGGLDESQLEEYLSSNGYAKEVWVLAKKYLDAVALGEYSSDFITVANGKITLKVDEQGGLGATKQGLGIVDIPSHLLENITIKIDSELSDTSENAVQNKVIKAYVDLHPQYEVIEEVEVPDLPEGSGGSQGPIDLTGYATEQWVEGKGYATEQWVSNQGFVDKAYVGSQINAYSSNTYALIAALEERIAALEKMLEGTEGESGCYFVPAGVTYANNAISVRYDRVGVMTETLNVKTKAKIGESIATKESTVSPSLANLLTMFTIGINGDIATMLLPSQEYTVEITVETSDSNDTTTKKQTFTFTT